jgi:hypothetical protein
MMFRFSKHVVLLSLAISLSFVSAVALSSGSIAGRAIDANQAALIGATVKVRSVDTGRTVSVVTNADGLFVIPELPPGTYSVSIEKLGFRSVIRDRVLVTVGSSTVVDFTLSVGGVDENVTVETNELPLIERESPAVGTLVTRRFIENLPLNGRSFQTLIELTPGINLAVTSIQSTGQFSVNGQRTNANYFSVDGVSANIGSGTNFQFFQQASGSLPGLSIFGGTNSLASVDAVQEFRVQTSSYSAEFGRQPGGQISLVTRTGTNVYTGSLFNYFRNEALDANDWFENRAGRARGALRQNNFGGTFGGRLPVPNFGQGGPVVLDGRDRSFFFVSYEGLRLRQPQTGALIARVPSLAARNAATGVFKQVLEAFPLPNAPAVAGDPVDTERYIATLSYPSKVDALSIRVDQRFNDRVGMFVRFNDSPSSQRFRSFPSQNNAYERNIRTVTMGSTQTFSSSVTNDFRLNYSYTRGLFLFEGIEVDGSKLPDNRILFPSFAPPETASVSIFLGTGAAGISSANLTQGKTIGTKQRQWNLVDNMTVLRGNHEIKLGVDYRRLTPKVDSRALGISYTFSTPTSRATGVPTQIQVQALAPITDFKVENFSAFAQDTWRVNRRLTLTGGMRWELNPPLSGERLPFQIQGIDDLLTATLAPAGTRQWKTEYDNFAPRIGVALALTERADLVIRGGFGIYFDLGTGTALRGYTSYPYNSLRTISSGPALRFPALEADIQPLPFQDASPPPYSANFFFFDPNLRLPQTRQWNVSLEKALGSRQAFTVSYVGSKAIDLLRNEQVQNFNSGFVQSRFCTPTQSPLPAICAPAGSPSPIVRINPAIFGPTPAQLNNTAQILSGSAVSITRNGSYSNYHALQTQFRSRFTAGFQGVVSYTFSKAIDDVSDETFTGIPLSNTAVALERGVASFDVTHNLVAALSYDLPSWRLNSFTKAIFGGWAVDSIVRLRSGLPFSVISQSFDPLNIGSTRRVNLVPGQEIWLRDETVPGGAKLNPSAFAAPALGLQGSLGRNALRGFGLTQVDLSARRTFGLGEKFKLQLRGEAFNILNTPNFGFPAASFGFSGFGIATTMAGRAISGTSTTGPSNGFNSLYQVGGARSIQLSVKLTF